MYIIYFVPYKDDYTSKSDPNLLGPVIVILLSVMSRETIWANSPSCSRAIVFLIS